MQNMKCEYCGAEIKTTFCETCKAPSKQLKAIYLNMIESCNYFSFSKIALKELREMFEL